MQNQMTEALWNSLLMLGSFAAFAIGAGFLVQRQAHKWRALAEAEREAEREAKRQGS